MSKYYSLRESTRKLVQEYFKSIVGSPAWLERSKLFDPCYKVAASNVPDLQIVSQKCGIAKRHDSLDKFNILVANLLRYRHRRPIEISLTKEHKMADMIKALEGQDYLKVWRGYHYADNSRNSRISPTEKFLRCLDKVSSSAIIVDPTYKDLIILKDENGQPKDYKETDKTRKIKKILMQANKVNRAADIVYKKKPSEPGKPISTALFAIYHRKFTLYGRLHTKGCLHYQGLGEDQRAKITINGDPIVELDFSSIHPHLLYAEEGIQLPPDLDPYSVVIDDPALRGFLKECLLSLFNATENTVKLKSGKEYRRTAEHNSEAGINMRMGENPKAKKQLAEHGIKVGRQIIDRFKEAHKPIAHHFCNDDGTGIRLMNKDATIALDIVDYFSKQGIPILAIHDSFIVQKQHKSKLLETMRRAYDKHTGGKGFTCPIK